MKRSGAVKFPNSVQLFKFCQKVMMHQRSGKVRDQEVGSILNFNPSDCSHWKRGEKNVKSVFALAKLAETLNIESGLIHDVAGGNTNVDEAYYEYMESRSFAQALQKASQAAPEALAAARQRVQEFVNAISAQCDFVTPPLYIPELMRTFAFVSTQAIDMMDKLSRILRVKPGQYCVQFRKGDLKPQTRMSVVKDLARIIFEGERERFPELGKADPALVEFEEVFFTANILAPKSMILDEISKLDLRRNVISELAALFWVPKSLVCFQMRDMVRTGERTERPTAAVHAEQQRMASPSI